MKIEVGDLVDAQTEARAIITAEGDDVEWFHPDEVVRMIATALAAKDDEMADIRLVLASIEVCSLPDDFPTIEMAKLRMQTLNERTLDGLAAIGRAERAEAALTSERAALADARKVLEEAREIIDACAGDNRPARSWAITVRDGIDAALAAIKAAIESHDLFANIGRMRR